MIFVRTWNIGDLVKFEQSIDICAIFVRDIYAIYVRDICVWDIYVIYAGYVDLVNFVQSRDIYARNARNAFVNVNLV